LTQREKAMAAKIVKTMFGKKVHAGKAGSKWGKLSQNIDLAG
jgi:hypothetical protein